VLENGTHLPLQKPIINIGRHQDNQIVIQDPTASRAHCQLRVRWGNYILFDLQSKAGTFVNDRKIKEHRLQSGDVIRVAGTRLIYLEYNNEAENRTRAGDTQTDVDPL
jgi:pSer/pThr/pTyr-binding forkhead associated (FHA) protein